jgi:hypothetical protein
MKNIKLYETFIQEGKGIHPAIYSHLEKFFKNNGNKASYADAKKYVSKEMKTWNLSKSDFEEAKKKFC